MISERSIIFSLFLISVIVLSSAFNMNAVAESNVLEPTYIDNIHWNTFADFLRSVQLYQSVQNMTQYLLENNLSQKFIDDFFLEYPEFQLQNTGGVIGAGEIPTFIFVHGELYAENDNRDLAGVKACLYSVDSENNNALMYYESSPACSTTNTAGLFGIPATNNNINDNTGLGYYVNFSLANNNVTIQNQNNTLLTYSSERKSEDKFHFSISTSAKLGNFVDYYGVFDTINKAHKKIQSDVDYKVPPVIIRDDLSQNYSSYTSSNNSSIMSSGSIKNQSIFVNSSVHLMYEYGRHIQYKVYQDQNSTLDLCGHSSFESVSTYECSWVNGWAWFVSAWTNNSPQLRTIFNDEFIDIDLENATYTNSSGTFEFSRNDNQISEGWVAAALWDMHDSVNERGDTVSNELDSIWKAFNASAAQNINQFKTEWDNNGSPSMDGILNNTPIPSKLLTFNARLESDLTRIIVTFNQSTTHDFTKDDFRISDGSIISVDFIDPYTRHLKTENIPHNTLINVTYTGETNILGSSLLEKNTSTSTLILRPPLQPILLPASANGTDVTLCVKDPKDKTITNYVILRTDVTIQNKPYDPLYNNSPELCYIDDEPKSSNTYNYTVFAQNELDTSPLSNTITVELIDESIPPHPPVLLDNPKVNGTKVTLCVKDPKNPHITGYSVWEKDTNKTNPILLPVITNTGSSDLCYIHTVSKNSTFAFRVAALVGDLKSSLSNEILVKVMGNHSVYLLPINDTFDESLDGWEYMQLNDQSEIAKWCDNINATTYKLEHSTVHGGSAYLHYTDSCWFGFAGAVKSFTSNATGNILNISFNIQALAQRSLANNVHIAITYSDGMHIYDNKTYDDAKNDTRLYSDSGIMPVNIPPIPFDPSRCPCSVFVFLYDAWKVDWNQRFYLDNFTASVTSGISGASADTNELRLQEHLLMQFGNGTIIVTHKSSDSNSAFFDWDNFKDTTQYTAEIYPVDDPTSKRSYTTTSSEYRFTELDSSTEYIVTISKSGDPSTSISLGVLTDP